MFCICFLNQLHVFQSEWASEFQLIYNILEIIKLFPAHGPDPSVRVLTKGALIFSLSSPRIPTQVDRQQCVNRKGSAKGWVALNESIHLICINKGLDDDDTGLGRMFHTCLSSEGINEQENQTK